MIIPSIDLLGGQTVQLIGGKERALDLGDPIPFLDQFRLFGETAVVDLDAALRQGDNEGLILKLVARGRCRVGGGIRSVERGRFWLDHGAEKIVLGTAATPEILGQFPRERVVAALDAKEGEVVVDGWRVGTGRSIEERIDALKPYSAHFLVTFVESEGRLQGINLERARAVVAAAGSESRVTIAGGVTTVEDVRALDQMGADAQVGMALYTNRFSVAEAVGACLMSDRDDGLWPTLVCDEGGRALGLTYSNQESLSQAASLRQGVYWSRKRGLWHKGATSGATQELRSISVDCDRDALRFVVRQNGAGFCHTGDDSCFGPIGGVAALERRLVSRLHGDLGGNSNTRNSYTHRVATEAGMLSAKLQEEAAELAEASDSADICHEAADLLYFTMVALARANVPFAAVEEELDRRDLVVSRRHGDVKESAR
jgi:phosphoribosyl-ATP pyrophosphohydrolase